MHMVFCSVQRSTVCVPDLVLYSVPVGLLWFSDALPLQLAEPAEHASARRYGSVDIAQETLHIGAAVSDEAVIQLLQLIREREKQNIVVTQWRCMLHSDAP